MFVCLTIVSQDSRHLLYSHKIMISLPVRHCNLAAAIQLLSQFLYIHHCHFFDQVIGN
ncbi:Uncharacterised protein [Segatella copri]|nr:Uncharacterised protein [Segatella copri]